MKFTEWGSKRQKSWYRQMRRKERKEYQDRNNIGWDLNALFPTAWWSFQPDHLYADVDKTVPATIGGGIASFDDLSGNGVTGPQPVSTARPILGRVPRTGRRNAILGTESPETWNQSGKGACSVGEKDPEGFSLLTITEAGISSVISPHTQYPMGQANANTGEITLIRSYEVRAIGNTRYLRIGNVAGSVVFDLQAGTVVYQGAQVFYVDILPLQNGAYRVETRVTTTDTSNSGLLQHFNWSPNWVSGTYLSDEDQVGSELYVRNPVYWIENSLNYSDPVPYQRVTTAYDVTEAGVPSVYYARYDSADDVLPHNATLPAITDGTVILIGRNGIWIDEGYSFAGGNWSFGPTTYANGPDGIIGVAGDMLDLVVLDRPLTADERDRVVAYGVKRGSAGLITIGPEEKQNYLFPGAPGMAEYISGGDYFRIERSGSSIGMVSYEIEPTPALYLAQYEWLSGAGLGVRNNASVMSGYEVDTVDPLRNVVLSIAPGPLRFYHGGTPTESTLRVITLRRLILPGETP